MSHPNLRNAFAAAMLLAVIAIARAVAQNAPVTAPTNSIPTMDDLHQMYDDGEYRICLQQIARVMQLSPEKKQRYDATELQLLRGESLISLGDPRTARRWLEEASKSDRTEIATPARGLLALVVRSKGKIYTPRVANGSSGERTPLDISDPKQRTEALNALLADEIGDVETKAKAALQADTLGPTLALVPKLLELHAAEYLATGKTERTGPIGKAVGEHARDLMNRELTSQDERITGVERLANQLNESSHVVAPGGRYRWWYNTASRRGLTSDERDNLQDTIEYLTKLENIATDSQRIARSVNGNVSAWGQIISRASQVKAHAQAVLDAEGIKTGND